MENFDWNDVAVFLAIAETGSLSAAARRLGTSQPTMGRQLRRVEDRLGRSLFRRQARGLALTEAGQQLLDPARRMAEAMQGFRLAAAGQETGLAGSVRITASDVVAHHVLPPILTELRRNVPEIQIDLLPSDASDNLLFREADIAVRMYRSTQLDIVTRHLGDMAVGVFAARSYIDRHGRPSSPEDFPDHDLVGYDRDDRILRGMRQMGIPAQRSDFALRCDSQTTNWELVRAGGGIGFIQRHIGRADPKMVELFPDLDIPSLPVWLAAASATRHTPRIARVWDHLADGLQQLLRAQS